MLQENNPKGKGDPVVFDLQGTLENLDGDRDLFRGMVVIFLEELPLWMAEIERGYETGDSQAVEKAAHSIKGSAGNFRASHAAEIARRLEVLGRNNNVDEMGSTVASLREAVAALSKALQEVVDTL